MAGCQAVASDPVPYEVLTCPSSRATSSCSPSSSPARSSTCSGSAWRRWSRPSWPRPRPPSRPGTESFDLDTSTEFLLLAATLVELKTRYLLIEDDDDVPDELPTPEDRDLLLARLLQGRTFKEAARVLAGLIQAADRCAPRRMGPEEPLASVDIDPLESVTADELRLPPSSGPWPPGRWSTCTT